MGDRRKLQTEIDRALKKVQEHVEVFDSIWEKVHDTEHANQKEKFEADLKKEIKKLQRYRDQIKTWAAAPEIKDKKQLTDARKLIEREMERFKVCERETKTKAFSKEGLGQQAKLDPRERARNEAREWLNRCVDELNTQLDSFEAEVESLSTAKKGKQKPPRLTHLEESVTRHREHITKLELILRLLDNEAINPDDLSDFKDMIEDYVERNQDSFEEFADSVTDLYESLNLDALSAAMLAGEVSMKRGGRDSDDSASDSGSSDDDDAGSAPVSPAPETLKSPAAARAAVAPPPSPAAPKAAPPPAVPRPTVAPRPAVAQPAPAPVPAASARVLPSAGANGDGGKPGPAEVRPQQSWAVPLPMTPQEPPPQQQQSAPLYAQRTVPPPAVQPQPQQPPQPAADKAQFLSRLQQRVPPAPPSGVPPPGYKQPFGDAAAAAAGMGPAGVSRGASGDAALFNGDLREDGPLASTSADLRRALEGLAGLRDSTPAFDAVTSLRLLESSFASGMPQAGDSQVLRRGRVRTLVPVPPSFPVAPPPVMENPALFERLDLDALFFSFYFQQGTVQQLLAARELKRSNWRFHKKYNTWFARAEEPKLVTDDLEQGAYVYFDFAQDWCQRSRQDFSFEYQWLE